MGKREEESMEEVRWETLFLNRPVRVLLVEGDDSTRQIISALLRKCGYKGLFFDLKLEVFGLDFVFVCLLIRKGGSGLLDFLIFDVCVLDFDLNVF